MPRRLPTSTLFPYTTLFRSERRQPREIRLLGAFALRRSAEVELRTEFRSEPHHRREGLSHPAARSEEHTSELQSHVNLVCRLLLEKKKNVTNYHHDYLQILH